METPELKKAMTTLEFLSQNKEVRRLYEARQKALMDERSALSTARRKGIEEGIKEGIEEGIEEGKAKREKEIAIRLLADGVDISKVADLTGLTEAEVKILKTK
jgi:predicted transposase/invertase (TIGR01784 family)